MANYGKDALCGYKDIKKKNEENDSVTFLHDTKHCHRCQNNDHQDCISI